MVKKKRLLIVLASALVLLVLICFGIVKAGQVSKVKKQIDIGNKYFTDGKYKEAYLAFEKAISVDKKNVEARVGAAKAYAAINEFQKAEDILKKGIELLPKQDTLYLELSSLYLKEAKIEEAIKILDIGYGKTKSDRIKKKLKEIEQKLSIVIKDNPLQISKSTELKLVMEDKNLSASWEIKNKGRGYFTKGENQTVQFIAAELGTQTIAAKIGSIEKTAQIEVKEKISASIEIVSLPATATVGDSVDIKAIVKDQSGAEMNVEPTWQLSGDEAKLATTKGKTNKIEFVKEGKVQVTVTFEGFKKTVEVTVQKKVIPVREAVYEVYVGMKALGQMDLPPEMLEPINKNKEKVSVIYSGVESNKKNPLEYKEVFLNEAQFNTLANSIKFTLAWNIKMEDKLSASIVYMCHGYEDNGKIYQCMDCNKIYFGQMDKSQHGKLRNDTGYVIGVKVLNMVNNQEKGWQYISFFIKKDFIVQYHSGIAPNFRY